MTVPVGSVVVGDCREVLRTWPDACIDSVVTDPPYHLVSLTKRFGKPGSAPAKGPAFQRHNAGFMGCEWDGGDVAFDPATWADVLRVLKPGGHLLAFGGDRTVHRLACAIEDAGFEIRGQIAYLYAMGFPKSLDVSKAIDKMAGHWRGKAGAVVGPNGAMSGPNYERTDKGDPVTAAAAAAAAGWGTALRPSMELIVMSRRPLIGTVAQNVLRHGTGAINIDATRIGTIDDLNGGAYSGGRRRRDEYTPTDSAPGAVALSRLNRGIGEYQQPAGRWPSNVALSHTPECREVGSRKVATGTRVLRKDHVDRSAFGWGSKKAGPNFGYADKDGAEVISAWDCHPECPVRMLDEQSGERPSPKSFSRPREYAASSYRVGDAPLQPGYGDTGGASRFMFTAKADGAERREGLAQRSNHPTVKPVDLMAWLVKMVTPPDGIVCDPFLGSGTTAVAAQGLGFKWVGIEQSREYAEDAVTRIGMFARLEESTP